MTLSDQSLADDDLRRMALGRTETLPAPARPFPEIAARAARIRRTRTAAIGAATAGTLGAAALAVAVAVTGLPGGGSPRLTPGGPVSQQPASPTAAGTSAPPAKSCSTGYSESIGFDQIPGLLHLPPDQVAGDPLVRSWARDGRSDCPVPPVAAVWYATSGDQVSARMQVDGPGATDPYRAEGSGFDGTISTETIGERATTVYATKDGSGRLAFYWTEPDGTEWAATVEGLPATAARAAVAGLKVSAGRVQAGSQPDALPGTVLGTGRIPPRHVRSFFAGFGSRTSDRDSWTVEISDVTDPGVEGVMTARRVLVNGRTGWAFGKGDPGAAGDGAVVSVSWRGDDGNLYQVQGAITLAKALLVAESLVPVAADDSRLTTSTLAPGPPDSETNTVAGRPTSTG